MSEFTVKGEVFEMVDASRLTFGEAAAVERVTGHTLQQIQNDDSLSGSVVVVQALLWVSMKRKQHDLQFKDLNDLSMGDIEWPEADESEAEVEADPTDAEGSPSAA